MVAEASLPAPLVLKVCIWIATFHVGRSLSPAFSPRAFPRTAAASLAQQVQRAPLVCEDWPQTWVDTQGRSCADYGSDKLCLQSGDYGPGWQQSWGAFRKYGNEGSTALGACCACGGGWSSYPATCSYLQCPGGLMSKANAWNLYCKGLKCNLDADLWTCCEAHPEVQQAVSEVQKLAEEELQVARVKVAEAAVVDVEKLRGITSQRAEDLGRTFVGETSAMQQHALSTAQADFAAMTQNSASVASTAEYQIRMSSYLAARDAPEGFVNTSRLRAEARRAVKEFAKAQEDWRQTDEISHHVVETGKQEWANYYKDLNETWPIVVHGISTLNEALNRSTVPGQAVRWSEQAVRLASDQAQITNAELNSIDAQVTQAEERASAALQATTANMGKISTLENMVAAMTSGR